MPGWEPGSQGRRPYRPPRGLLRMLSVGRLESGAWVLAGPCGEGHPGGPRRLRAAAGSVGALDSALARGPALALWAPQIWVSSPHNASGYYTVYGEEALHADHFSARLSFGDTQTVWARTGYLGFLRRTELTDASGGEAAPSARSPGPAGRAGALLRL